MPSEKLKKIESVINARLKLQSTQKSMVEKFDFHLPSLLYLKLILPTFQKWEEDKKTQFIYLLGGKSNKKWTTEYLNSFNPKQKTAENQLVNA